MCRMIWRDATGLHLPESGNVSALLAPMWSCTPIFGFSFKASKWFASEVLVHRVVDNCSLGLHS